MRQICLDTETTGLDPKTGDRIVEVGAVEIIGRTLSDKEDSYFHVYVNPERDVPPEVVKVHGLTNEFLADKPVFAEIAPKFIEFIKGAELIIHNASFDIGFLNMELKRLKLGKVEDYCEKVTDSLEMAQKHYPGLRNTLDVLCSRLEIDNSSRTLHGALLDSQLLAEVYLAMTREQGSLLGEAYEAGEANEPVPAAELFAKATAPADELAVHQAFLEMIAKKSKVGCRWTQALQENSPQEEKGQ